MQENSISFSQKRTFIRIIRIALRLEKRLPENPDRPKKLSIKEVAVLIKRTPSTLWRWRQKPDCKLKPVVKADGEVFYLDTDVKDYLQNSKP